MQHRTTGSISTIELLQTGVIMVPCNLFMDVHFRIPRNNHTNTDLSIDRQKSPEGEPPCRAAATVKIFRIIHQPSRPPYSLFSWTRAYIRLTFRFPFVLHRNKKKPANLKF